MDSKDREILKAKRQQDIRSSCEGETPGTTRDGSAALDVNSADDIRHTTKCLVTKPINSEESIETDTQAETEAQNAIMNAKSKKNDTFDSVRLTMQHIIDEEGNKKKVDPTKNTEEKTQNDKKTKKQTPKAKERGSKRRRAPRRKPAVPKKRIRYSKATWRTPGIRLYKKRQEMVDSASDSDLASISSPSSETDTQTD